MVVLHGPWLQRRQGWQQHLEHQDGPVTVGLLPAVDVAVVAEVVEQGGPLVVLE